MKTLNSKKSLLASQSGQGVVELIMITVMLVGLTFLISQQFKDRDLFSNLVQGPWKVLSGMLQNGSWETPERSMALHPNSHSRHISLDGEAP